MEDKLENPHVGTILEEEFLTPNALSIETLAKEIDYSEDIIKSVIQNQSDISVELDQKLSKYFDLSIGYWLRLQEAFYTDEQMADKARSDQDVSEFSSKVVKRLTKGDNSITVFREEKRLSLSDLAKMTELTVDYIQKLEEYKTPLPYSVAEKIARVLNITPVDLFMDKKIEKIPNAETIEAMKETF